jgi:hypothetical protein
MVHGFLQMRGLVPDAETATEEIAGFTLCEPIVRLR